MIRFKDSLFNLLSHKCKPPIITLVMKVSDVLLLNINHKPKKSHHGKHLSLAAKQLRQGWG